MMEVSIIKNQIMEEKMSINSNTNRQVDMERLVKFLDVVGQMKESAVIFSPEDMKEMVRTEINRVFKNRKTHELDEQSRNNEETDKIFRESLKGGTLMLINLNGLPPERIVRNLEQLLEDGAIPYEYKGNWRKIEPSGSWQAIIWVNTFLLELEEYNFTKKFNHRLVIE
jgi:hypothetical protein